VDLLDAAVCADEHRRAVAGVDDRHRAVVAEPADDGGGEAVRWQERLEKLVQALHRRGRIAAGACARGDAALQLFLDHRHHERGGEPLPCYIAEGEPETAGGAMREPEVAGEGFRGDGDWVDVELRSRTYAITRARSRSRGTLEIEN